MSKRKLVPPEQARGNAAGSFNTERDDGLANARAQGQAQFNSIGEMVDALGKAREVCAVGTGASDRELNELVEDAEHAIHEDALSVEVRSDWVEPGEFLAQEEGFYRRGLGTQRAKRIKPVEYRILLYTGGPAVQITGELDEHGNPVSARMEVQDWFTPWTEFRPVIANPADSGDIGDGEAVMLAYARCFWFGE